MSTETTDHTEDARGEALWMRILVAIAFVILFGLAETVLVFIAVIQILSTALTGGPNAALVDFGSMLGKWTQEVVAYQSMKSDTRPFPWGSWPKD